ncbi:putative ferric-chelate reductase 1 [Xiphophorus maculatus]|uniref:putative ferric-chelate reductase 1 n=1 Tax=Xiphophorus maculatus TaxID=8083 RepID=UPI000293C3B3|nr:putative ferric-chelate reductase 1 [Xiphophorus maculatus]
MEHKMMQVFAAMMVFLALSFQPVLSQGDISKTGCGTTKQCVQNPANCDPAGNTTDCLFGSARPTASKAPNGIDLAFELSGNFARGNSSVGNSSVGNSSVENSSGYVAVGLTNEAQTKIMLFICGQNSSNNGSFFSMSTIYNAVNKTANSTLAKAMTDVKNIVNGTNIKCTFNVASLNVTTEAGLRSADTTFRMVVGSGTGLDFNNFQLAATSNATDFSNFLPSANTTAKPSGANRPFYSNAVLPLVSFVTLSILTFA